LPLGAANTLLETYDNATMQSFFSHLKIKAPPPYEIRIIEETQKRIVEFHSFLQRRTSAKKDKQADAGRVPMSACSKGIFNVRYLGS